MTVQHFRDLLKAQPFRPFRITLSSGRSFDIKHPEMAWLTRTALFVGHGNPASEDPPEYDAMCSLLHITNVELITTEKVA